MKPLIFTLLGKDKPGLIDSLAQKVFNLGGNWLASSFAHMAGNFTGFVQIDLPQEKHQELIEAFSRHPDLQINLVTGEDDLSQQLQSANIEIMGNDKPGIVQELTSVLHQFNINIVKFESSCGSAPNWGNSLFKAKAVINVPTEFDLSQLREALEDISDDLVVDLDLN